MTARLAMRLPFTHLAREWVLVAELFVLSLATAGNALVWSKTLTGYGLSSRWLFPVVLPVFGCTVMWRLASLHNLLDERDELRKTIAELTPLVQGGNQLPEKYGPPGRPASRRTGL